MQVCARWSPFPLPDLFDIAHLPLLFLFSCVVWAACPLLSAHHIRMGYLGMVSMYWPIDAHYVSICSFQYSMCAAYVFRIECVRFPSPVFSRIPITLPLILTIFVYSGLVCGGWWLQYLRICFWYRCFGFRRCVSIYSKKIRIRLLRRCLFFPRVSCIHAMSILFLDMFAIVM